MVRWGVVVDGVVEGKVEVVMVGAGVEGWVGVVLVEVEAVAEGRAGVERVVVGREGGLEVEVGRGAD